jgi:dissimilatory sulfite reductase (desulfoviridin) alpha/beta subunit
LEWEPDAAKAIERAPFFVRGLARRRVEALVAGEGRRTVTLADVRRAKDAQLAALPSTPAAPTPSAASPTLAPARPPLDGAAPVEEESGFTEAQIREVERLAESLAGHEARSHSVKGCGGTVGCPLALADVRSATDAIVAAIEASGLTEAQAARHKGPVLSHHKLKAAVAGCPNCCSEPQIRDFAVVARSRPGRGNGECAQCGACEAACREEAVQVLGDGPAFDAERCVGCGSCIGACPSGAIVAQRCGWDVLVGGRLGRHPRLALTVAEGVSEVEALKIVRAWLALLVDEGRPGERLGQLLDRVGLEGLELR